MSHHTFDIDITVSFNQLFSNSYMPISDREDERSVPKQRLRIDVALCRNEFFGDRHRSIIGVEV